MRVLLAAVLIAGCGPGPESLDAGLTDAACSLSNFYPDSDGDGFGSSYGAPLVACERPAGYQPKPSDCADSEFDAHPGSDIFYARPIASTQSFDYNCDGRDELQHDQVESNPQFLPTCNACLGANTVLAWTSGPPACGASGTLATLCNTSHGRCFVSSAKATQGCR